MCLQDCIIHAELNDGASSGIHGDRQSAADLNNWYVDIWTISP